MLRGQLPLYALMASMSSSSVAAPLPGQRSPEAATRSNLTVAATPDDVVAEVAAITLNCVPIPESFKCPMTMEIMHDPVATHDGHVYERAAIEQWFQRGNRTSPITGAVLPSLALVAEAPMRRAIEEYTAMRPALVRTELDNKSLQSIVKDLQRSLQNKAGRPEQTAFNPQEVEESDQGNLLDAAQRGNALQCLEIMAHSKFNSINSKDSSGCTALHHVARQGLGEVAFAILAWQDFDSAWDSCHSVPQRRSQCDCGQKLKYGKAWCDGVCDVCGVYIALSEFIGQCKRCTTAGWWGCSKCIGVNTGLNHSSEASGLTAMDLAMANGHQALAAAMNSFLTMRAAPGRRSFTMWAASRKQETSKQAGETPKKSLLKRQQPYRLESANKQARLGFMGLS